MKFFVVFVCCVCFIRSIVSLFSSISDYIGKPFSFGLLVDLLFEFLFYACTLLVVYFASRYAFLVGG